MTNPPLDLPAHTGSSTSRLLGATVLVGVVTMILLGFFVVLPLEQPLRLPEAC